MKNFKLFLSDGERNWEMDLKGKSRLDVLRYFRTLEPSPKVQVTDVQRIAS